MAEKIIGDVVSQNVLTYVMTNILHAFWMCVSDFNSDHYQTLGSLVGQTFKKITSLGVTIMIFISNVFTIVRLSVRTVRYISCHID